jgi:alpha-D-xyloside xylohydrolase
VVLRRGTVEVEIADQPFRITIRRDGIPLLSPPPDRDGGHDWTESPHGDAPSTSNASIVYRVDPRRFGYYVGVGRAPRVYGLFDLREVQNSEDSLTATVGTDDPLGRLASVAVKLQEDDRVSIDVQIEPGVVVEEVALRAQAADPEGFYGFGERFARVDHRGQQVLDWVEDSPYDPRPGHDWTYWSAPFVVSSRGIGLHLHTTRGARFDLGHDDPDAWESWAPGPSLTVTAFASGTPAKVLDGYTSLTGRPRLLPPWALSVWKTLLGGEDRVMADALRLRDESLGVSVIWIYDQREYETNSGWGSAMGYPSGEYPDMARLVRHLHDMDFRVLGYLNNYFVSGRPRYEDGVRHGYFLRRADGRPYDVPCFAPETGPLGGFKAGGLLDPTNPDAVGWWQEMLRALLQETGYDGWMNDFGEQVPSDAVAADGSTGETLHNAYPVLYQTAAVQVVDELGGDAVFFSRSGHTGSTAATPIAWPGDQHCDWSGDRGIGSAVHAGLSLGMSGVGAFGPDIGGFYYPVDDPALSESVELWVRWCQLGALTPVMRDHLGYKRAANPDAVDLFHNGMTMATWRAYARLHNALLPYLLSANAESARTGLPIMRHLVLESPDDPAVLSLDDQYLLGPDLLVAPVLAPGERRRYLYLPRGHWVDFWTGESHLGGGHVEVEAPLGRIPLFVRHGSPIPVSPDTVSCGSISLEELLSQTSVLAVLADGAPPSSVTRSRFDGVTVTCTTLDGHTQVDVPSEPIVVRHGEAPATVLGIVEPVEDSL